MSDIPPALPVPTLDYASRSTIGMDAVTLAHFRRYARWSLGTAILSGLCVGVCFLTLSAPRIEIYLLHLLVFAATLACAAIAGRALVFALNSHGSGASYRLGLVLDLVATLGLIVLGTGPILFGPTQGSNWPENMSAILALAYACLAVSVPRHVIHYRRVAMLLAMHGSVWVRGMRVLGYFKAVYEGLWLSCCAVVLLAATLKAHDDTLIWLAVGAFGGCIGFIGIWAWMIIRHSLLIARLRL